MSDNNQSADLKRAGMVAILANWQVAATQHGQQRLIREKADKEMLRLATIIGGYKAACRAFGFDPDNKDSWASMPPEFMREARDLFNKTRPRNVDEWSPAPAEGQKQVQEVGSIQSATPISPTAPSVREAVLDRLKEAGESGAKAAAIRAYIEKTYSKSTHEKTVGMTLYRLLKDGLVRRKGHQWFFVPQSAETKNPGGETPGQKSIFD